MTARPMRPKSALATWSAFLEAWLGAGELDAVGERGC